MTNQSENFAFILGREKKLAIAELEAVLNSFYFDFDIYKITGNVAFANIANFVKDDAISLIDRLAGTIKIFSVIQSTSRQTIKQDLTNIIVDKADNRTDKFNYGISSYDRGFYKDYVNKLGIDVKKELKAKGLKTRYVGLTESSELSSIQSLKNNLHDDGVEIGIFDEKLGVLIALNNPENWSKVDYGKPASDKYSGMLPPRLARTMVNIAIGEISRECGVRSLGQKSSYSSLPTTNSIVIDPFCGSGGVLLEALQLGYCVIGSDVSEKAVRDSQKNVAWLNSVVLENKAHNSCVFRADATSEEYLKQIMSSEIFDKNPQNPIFVSEPYLGRPKKFKSSYNGTVGEYKEVKRLYIDYLANIAKLLNNNKIREIIICLVFPAVETSDGKIYHLHNECVDEIKNLGYTQVCNSFLYGRDYQVVKRELVLLKIQQ